MSDIDSFKKKILELEKEVGKKDALLRNYQNQIQQTSEKLDKIMSDMGRDLELFGKLQKMLSPTELPHINGFEFSTKFLPGFKTGGDYFDLFDHADRSRFGLLMSSASGYSLSAQLLSLIIRLTAKSESKKYEEPHLMVEYIYKELYSTLRTQDSASLLYAMIDKRTDIMSFCLVGDAVICVRRPGQSAVELFTAEGAVFKPGHVAALDTRSFQLKPKDRIIILSGGAFEVVNPEGKQWRTDNLLSVLNKSHAQTVHEIRNEILLDLEKFSGSPHFPRDLTVIVSEVKEPGLRLAKH
ncbi:MAG: SpoIIE family protein phosphatase [Bdellovibrionota bacterium]